MKQNLDQIKRGVSNHEEEKKTPPEFLVYEKMSEEELLAEHKKETSSIDDQRQSFEDTMKTEEERGTDAGKSYIGDNKITIDRINKLQEIMDKQGIPYDKFE